MNPWAMDLFLLLLVGCWLFSFILRSFIVFSWPVLVASHLRTTGFFEHKTSKLNQFIEFTSTFTKKHWPNQFSHFRKYTNQFSPTQPKTKSPPIFVLPFFVSQKINSFFSALSKKPIFFHRFFSTLPRYATAQELQQNQLVRRYVNENGISVGLATEILTFIKRRGVGKARDFQTGRNGPEWFVGGRYVVCICSITK